MCRWSYFIVHFRRCGELCFFFFFLALALGFCSYLKDVFFRGPKAARVWFSYPIGLENVIHLRS
jgi:hypothetical protein